jgi:LmbE family N-acetylglucosaminyl deacetylase
MENIGHTWTERDLIPFESSAITGERILVIAPHPDDETLGCGGSLIQHVERGEKV